MTEAFVPRAGEPLAPHTTLGVGGAAQFYGEVAGGVALARALEWADERGLPVTVLGGGSNVVISDRGVAGLVLRLTGASEVVVSQSREHVELRVEGGRSWDGFVEAAVRRGYAGVECLSGIPGLVGATPLQNVGAYGQEVSQTIVRVHAYDRVLGREVDLAREDCGFGYRSSHFKADPGGRFVVLAVAFRLRPGGAPCLAYPDVARRFASAATPSLSDVRQAVLETRRAKSMVLDASDPNARSCGSFFINPVVPSAKLAELEASAGATPPSYPQPDGSIKVPAAWLIERAGFSRGERFGNVGLSTRHTLALVCHDGARATDVVRAASCIRRAVADRFGIWLTPEPRFLGFESAPGELPSADD